MKFEYKGISFAKDINLSLAEFKEAFASHEVFKLIPHKERDAELTKVYKSVNKHNELLNATKKSRKPKRIED